MQSYEGINEADLIHALYHAMPPCAPGTPAFVAERLFGGPTLTLDAVRLDLVVGNGKLRLGGEIRYGWGDSVIAIDYYRGRPLKVELLLASKTFDASSYDRDAGDGAAAKVIHRLKNGGRK